MARQKFIAEMETKLKEFDAKLAQLAARPAPKSEEARLGREKTYKALRAQQDGLRDKLRQASATPDDAWHKFKDSMEQVYVDMVKYMDEACNKIDGPEDAGLY